MLKFVLLVSFISHVRSESSEAAVQATLQAIEEGLAQVSEDGSIRQLAINALMRSVSKSTRINETQNDTLKNVTIILLQVKGLLNETTRANQEWLDGYVDDLIECNTAYDDDTNAWEGKVTTRKSNYENCLGTQIKRFVTQEEECHEMRRWVLEYVTSGVPKNTTTGAHTHECYRYEYSSGYYGWMPHSGFGILGQCVDGDNTHLLSHVCENYLKDSNAQQDNYATWNTHLTDTASWFQTAYENFVDVATDCLNAENAYSQMAEQCRKNMTEFEVAMCNYRTEYSMRCEEIGSCWGRTQNDTRYNEVTNIGNSNAKLARLIDYIICLVNELRADRASEARNNCQSVLSEDLDALPYSDFQTVQHKVIPTQIVCSLDGSEMFTDVYDEDADDAFLTHYTTQCRDEHPGYGNGVWFPRDKCNIIAGNPETYNCIGEAAAELDKECPDGTFYLAFALEPSFFPNHEANKIYKCGIDRNNETHPRQTQYHRV